MDHLLAVAVEHVAVKNIPSASCGKLSIHSSTANWVHIVQAIYICLKYMFVQYKLIISSRGSRLLSYPSLQPITQKKRLAALTMARYARV